MVTEHALPIQCGVSGPIQAKSQSAQHVGIMQWVLGRNLYVHAPGRLSVKVSSRDIIDHDLAFATCFVPCSCPRHDKPQCFQWRRAGVESIVRGSAELLSYESATYVWLVYVAFVDINPLGTDYLASSLVLFSSRYPLIDFHSFKECHFRCSTRMNHGWIEKCAAHIINRVLVSVLNVQGAHAIVK